MSWLEDLHESDRIAAAEWIRDRARLGVCGSCDGPDDHGGECASIYPEIYGRDRARRCWCHCHVTGPNRSRTFLEPQDPRALWLAACDRGCLDCQGRHS